MSGALGGLKMRRKEVLRVERDVAVLKRDVRILLPAIASFVDFKVTSNDTREDVHANESYLRLQACYENK